MTPIRVLNSFPTWLPQTQTWMFNQIRFLPYDKIDSHVACMQTANLDQFSVPNIHALADVSKLRHLGNRIARRLGLDFRFDYLSSAVDNLKPKIVHSHFGNIGVLDSKKLANKNIRHVVTFYGYDVSMLPQEQPSLRDDYKKLFQRVDRVFCEGPFMAQKIVELGCSDQKVVVQHLGVNLDSLEYRPRDWDGNEPLNVLMAASFREKKGLPYAIRALGKLNQKNDIRLTIIGDANSSPASQAEKRTIIQTINESGLEGKTKLIGYQPHAAMIEQAYQHHVFMSTSVTASDGDTEGGAPVSLIEMAATGMPIISSKHCDIPGVILDGQTGWLAPERDIDAIVGCLQMLIESSPNWSGILLAGRKHVENEFSAQTQGKRLAELYCEVVA